MAQHLTYPSDVESAGRALRLDAAINASGASLQTVGDRIGLDHQVYKTRWRNGTLKTPELWKMAAEELKVPFDWLYHGRGLPPERVAARLAWLLSNPDLPPQLQQYRQDPKPMFSRRRKQSASDNLMEAVKALEDSEV